MAIISQVPIIKGIKYKKVFILLIILCFSDIDSISPSDCLSYPKDAGSWNHDEQPFVEGKRHSAEKFSSKLNDNYLKYNDNRGNQQEWTITGKVFEGALAGTHSPDVEQVPELHQHERGEEEREFVVIQNANVGH